MQLQQKLEQLEEQQKNVRILAIAENGHRTTGFGVINFNKYQENTINIGSNYTGKILLRIKDIQSIEAMTEIWNKADKD